MASEVEICNLALSNIRAGSINSLTEASLPAQICKLKYPFIRDQLLRDHSWQFAHKLVVLAETTDAIFNWARVYQYPSDCLSINKLIINFQQISQNVSSAVASRLTNLGLPLPNLNRQVPYEVFNINGNKVIAANEKELRADYRARVTDANLFDTQFITMFSYLLAAELAIPIVGGDAGRSLRSDSYKIYQQLLEAAVASDLNEQYHAETDSDFITTRG